MRKLSCLLIMMVLIFTGCGSVDNVNKNVENPTNDTTEENSTSDTTEKNFVHVDKTYTAYFVVDGDRNASESLKDLKVTDKTTSVYIDADFIDERDTAPAEYAKGRFYGNLIVEGMETDHEIIADVGGGVIEGIYPYPFDDTGEYFVIDYSDELINITGDSYEYSHDVVNQYRYMMAFKKDSLEEFLLYVWYDEYDENGEILDGSLLLDYVLVCAESKEKAQEFYDELLENVRGFY
ncbi:MAG: hypothetical protein K2M73_01520 [Lachnospiraceae bacterium]|nr:hypothetical protein [Lachnospiraceae bacterium]